MLDRLDTNYNIFPYLCLFIDVPNIKLNPRVKTLGKLYILFELVGPRNNTSI